MPWTWVDQVFSDARGGPLARNVAPTKKKVRPPAATTAGRFLERVMPHRCKQRAFSCGSNEDKRSSLRAVHPVCVSALRFRC